MTNPPRQRPGDSSEVGRRRLTPTVEELHLDGADPPPTSPAPSTEETPTPTPGDDIKVPLSTRVPQATATAARAAVMATAGHPGGCRSLADLVSQAIDAKVNELARQFNDGHPFPTPGQFRTGRPLGS